MAKLGQLDALLTPTTMDESWAKLEEFHVLPTPTDALIKLGCAQCKNGCMFCRNRAEFGGGSDAPSSPDPERSEQIQRSGSSGMMPEESQDTQTNSQDSDATTPDPTDPRRQQVAPKSRKVRRKSGSQKIWTLMRKTNVLQA